MSSNRKEYLNIISEYFDIYDTRTRKTLLSITEAREQAAVLSSLSSKLYNIIVDKSTEVDFGEIPKSKGDIAKIPNYMNILECLETIRGILVEFGENTESVDEIMKAIDNLRDSRALWEKGYTFNADMVIVFYETMALSIISSTSLLISTSIDYIKEPSENDYSITLDKTGYHKSKNYLLFKNLKRFNNAYRNGEVKKVMEIALKAKETVKESVDYVNEFSAAGIIAGIVTAGFAISLIGLIVNILQDLITLHYCMRQNISDYLDIQANLLAINAESVKLDVTKTEEKRTKIYNKQMKLVEKFKKLSNKFAIKMKSADKQSQVIIKKESSVKYKVDDVVDSSITTSSMF